MDWDRLPPAMMTYLQLVGALVVLGVMEYCGIGGEHTTTGIALLIGALLGLFAGGRSGSQDPTR